MGGGEVGGGREEQDEVLQQSGNTYAVNAFCYSIQTQRDNRTTNNWSDQLWLINLYFILIALEHILMGQGREVHREEGGVNAISLDWT